MKSLIIKIILAISVIFTLIVIYPSDYYILKDSYSYTDQEFSDDYKKGSIGSYLINLDRCKERYNYVIDDIKALGYPVERISAVDGNLLTKKRIKEIFDADAYRNYNGKMPHVGMMGCSLSHFTAWKRFLESDHEYALIFEDDVSFSAKYLKRIIDIVLKHQDLWDINSFAIRGDGAPIRLKKILGPQRLSVYTSKIEDAGCYLITRKAAKALLSKALPIMMPVDHYFTREWELGVRFTGVENARIVQQTFGYSEIQNSVDLEKNVTSFYDRVKFKIFLIKDRIIRTYITTKRAFTYRYNNRNYKK